MLQTMSLVGKIALVTGASRGIGRGIALQIGQAGAKVYITGRQPQNSLASSNPNLPTLESTAKEIERRGGHAVVVYTDHSDMDQVKALFDQITSENEGKLDILVNNAYAAVDGIANNMGKKFYDVEPEFWDTVNNVGLRNHYFCSVYAARLMTQQQPSQGLIVNISSAGGLRYLFNIPYGVGKEAMDRMAADMAVELKKQNVTVVSLWPGAVHTELADKILQHDDFRPGDAHGASHEQTMEIFKEGESTEFAGKAIVALASDAHVHNVTGRTLMTSDLGDQYGFRDVDGRHILSPRSFTFLFKTGIVPVPGGRTLASWIPSFIKVPGWVMAAASHRF